MLEYPRRIQPQGDLGMRRDRANEMVAALDDLERDTLGSVFGGAYCAHRIFKCSKHEPNTDSNI